MPVDPTPRPPRFTPAIGLVAVLGAGLALAAGWLDWRVEAERSRARFREDVIDVHRQLQQSLQAYQEVMYGLRGLLALTGEIGPAGFHDYVTGLNLFSRHRGLLAVSYGFYLEAGQRAAFERRLQAQWAALGRTVAIRPAGARPRYFVIAYGEPASRSEAAIGLDTLTLPDNQASLDLARDLGTVVASAPQKVVQHQGSDPGLLLRLAVYRLDLPQGDPEQRQRAAVGCLTLVFRTRQMIQDALGERLLERNRVLVEDAGSGALLFGEPLPAPSRWSRRFQLAPPSRVSLTQFGRTWTVEVAARPGMAGLQPWLEPLAVGLLVLAVTGLVIWVLLLESRVARRAQRLASDMTRQFQASEQALQRSQAQLEALIESTTDLIWSVDTEGRLLAWNSTVADYVRKAYGVEPAVGMAAAEVFPSDRLEGWLARYDQTLREGSCQAEVGLPDGRILSLSLHPIRQEGGMVGVSVFGKDVTDLKQAEAARARIQEQLLQSQKMDAIGQLAGGVAHDFNNMLMGITGIAEILKERNDQATPEERGRYLEMILTAAARAGDLTTKLLAASRRGQQSFAPVDLARQLRDTVALLERTLDKQIHVSLADEAGAAWVQGDASQLANLFMNLAINASHAMPGGGSLAFRLAVVHLEARDCAASPFRLSPGRHLQVDVQDTGCGMPPEVLRRVFEPFFTTKAAGKGTGLGLSAAYATVLDHQGSIEAQSQVGSGTRFRVLLPAGPVGAAEPPGAAPVTGTGTILVVDDEELVRTTYRHMLEGLGYQVRMAGNGQEAVDRFLAEHGTIDLVILDMVMPVMGGRQALARMRAIDPQVPVLLASGYADTSEFNGTTALAPAGFLRKPFRSAELSQAIAQALKTS
jgi:PAS domain S-box-containing protein